jgi:hypothetical protein
MYSFREKTRPQGWPTMKSGKKEKQCEKSPTKCQAHRLGALNLCYLLWSS